MEYDAVDGPDGIEIRVAHGDDYRTCGVCGGDCEPEPVMSDEFGARIAFTCPKHGIQSLVDPFEGKH